MDNRNGHESFTYTYSAKQQEELKRIRQRYLPPEEDKMSKLIRPDRSASKKGTLAAIIIGVVGTMLLGIGMCCTMVWIDTLFVPGIILGIIGFALIAVANPLYNHITKKERECIAPEIIRLTDELLK